MQRSLLALPAALALLAAAGAQASSGTIGLSGAVPTDCQLIVYQSVQTVDIVNGVSNMTLGSVGEQCNSGTGYTVTISSQNAGVMLSDGAQAVPYSIQWHDTGLRQLTAPVILTRTAARAYLTTRSFRVTVPAQPRALAGTYTDTITMTIAAR